MVEKVVSTVVLHQKIQKENRVVTIEFLGPISKEPMKLDISNLSELAVILKSDEALKPWLENSAVALNDTLIKDKNCPLKSGDKVSLLPPVCGG